MVRPPGPVVWSVGPVVSAVGLEKSEVTTWSKVRTGEKGGEDVRRWHLEPAPGQELL